MVSCIRKNSKEHVVVFSIIIAVITLTIASFFNWDANPVTGIDKLAGDILITLFCMGMIYILGIQDTAGFCKEGLAKGLLYGLPFVVIGIGAAVIGNIGLDLTQMQPISFAGIFLFTCNMFFVGVNEEISMRSLILNNLISKYGKSTKGIYKAILISAIVFGAIHLVNIFFVPPVTVIVQAVNAASAGVLFAAIYICSKNIWAGIIIHAVVDWLALFIGQCFVGGESVLSIEMTPIQGVIMIGLGSLPPIVIAVIMLRRNAR